MRKEIEAYKKNDKEVEVENISDDESVVPDVDDN